MLNLQVCKFIDSVSSARSTAQDLKKILSENWFANFNGKREILIQPHFFTIDLRRI
jgi:hypothetical protein